MDFQKIDYQKIYEVYERLLADEKKLSLLLGAEHPSPEISLLRELKTSNYLYQKELIAMMYDSFPETSFEVRRWTEENRKQWMILLSKYPVFWQGLEEKLIGVFWGMHIVGALIPYREIISSILKRDEMIKFAAASKDNSIISGLYALIDACFESSQREILWNKIDLAKNELL